MSVKQERVSIHGGRNSEEGGLITSGHVNQSREVLTTPGEQCACLEKEKRVVHTFSFLFQTGH